MATEISGTLVEVLTCGVSPYLEIEAVPSAIEALATYFETVTGVAKALRSWPEHPTDLDLTAGPVVSLSFIADRYEAIPPTALAAGGYRTDLAEIDVQLDLWCAYRSQRDDVGRAIVAAFHNSLPARHGLTLVSRGYHNRPLQVLATGGSNTGEPAAATEGEWRRTWLLKVRTDLVAGVGLLQPVQSSIILRPTIQEVAELDTEIL